MARSATSRGPAPPPRRLLPAALTTLTTPRPGEDCYVSTRQRFRSRNLLSFSCGGVGHLQRDCVQGPKCYNCSEIVGIPTIVCIHELITSADPQGHMSKDCTKPQRRACYQCGSEGSVDVLSFPAHPAHIRPLLSLDTFLAIAPPLPVVP